MRTPIRWLVVTIISAGFVLASPVAGNAMPRQGVPDAITAQAHHPRRHAHPLRHPQHGVHYNHSTASWYADGGQTASGWHAKYGFATCGTGGGPCYSFGTRVQFCLRRRCIVAVADDHGPYVAGRAFDLGASTAHAIGFSGVQTVAWRLLPKK